MCMRCAHIDFGHWKVETNRTCQRNYLLNFGEMTTLLICETRDHSARAIPNNSISDRKYIRKFFCEQTMAHVSVLFADKSNHSEKCFHFTFRKYGQQQNWTKKKKKTGKTSVADGFESKYSSNNHKNPSWFKSNFLHRISHAKWRTTSNVLRVVAMMRHRIASVCIFRSLSLLFHNWLAVHTSQ